MRGGRPGRRRAARRGGRLVSSARFTRGTPGPLALRGGRAVPLRPRATPSCYDGTRRDGRRSTTHHRASRRSRPQRRARAAAVAAAATTAARPRSAGTPLIARRAAMRLACGAVARRRRAAPPRPQREFAHGGNGPVDHRYHARPAISADGRASRSTCPAPGSSRGDNNGARDVFVRDAAARPHAARERRARRRRGQRDEPCGGDQRRRADRRVRVLGLGPRRGRRRRRARRLRPRPARRHDRLVAPGRSPALSADGRVSPTSSAGGVDVADLGSGAIRRVAAHAYRPSLSADGRFVAYESRAAHSARDTNRDWDVFRARARDGRNRAAQRRRRRRAAAAAQSLAAVLSADGSVAAFQSDAPLVRRRPQRPARCLRPRRRRPPDDARQREPLRAAGQRLQPLPVDQRRRQARRVRLPCDGSRARRAARPRPGLPARRSRPPHAPAERDPAGRASARTSFSPALAARAAIVAFPSFAYDLGPRDANQRVDIYLRKRRDALHAAPQPP